MNKLIYGEEANIYQEGKMCKKVAFVEFKIEKSMVFS